MIRLPCRASVFRENRLSSNRIPLIVVSLAILCLPGAALSSEQSHDTLQGGTDGRSLSSRCLDFCGGMLPCFLPGTSCYEGGMRSIAHPDASADLPGEVLERWEICYTVVTPLFPDFTSCLTECSATRQDAGSNEADVIDSLIDCIILSGFDCNLVDYCVAQSGYTRNSRQHDDSSREWPPDTRQNQRDSDVDRASHHSRRDKGGCAALRGSQGESPTSAIIFLVGLILVQVCIGRVRIGFNATATNSPQSGSK